MFFKNVRLFFSARSQKGFSLVEMMMAVAIFAVVIAGATKLFKMNKSTSDAAGKRLLATGLMSTLSSHMKQKAIPANVITTDPPPTASVDPDPPNPPIEPITKLVFKLASLSGASVENSYETVCRPTSSSWFAGTSQVALKRLGEKIAEVCGSRNPCPNNSNLPWVKIVAASPAATSWMPPVASSSRSYGLHAVALCIGWRPEGDGTYDIKAVGAYPNEQDIPVVVVSSLTITNSRLRTSLLQMRVP